MPLMHQHTRTPLPKSLRHLPRTDQRRNRIERVPHEEDLIAGFAEALGVVPWAGVALVGTGTPGAAGEGDGSPFFAGEAAFSVLQIASFQYSSNV